MMFHNQARKRLGGSRDVWTSDPDKIHRKLMKGFLVFLQHRHLCKIVSNVTAAWKTSQLRHARDLGGNEYQVSTNLQHNTWCWVPSLGTPLIFFEGNGLIRAASHHLLLWRSGNSHSDAFSPSRSCWTQAGMFAGYQDVCLQLVSDQSLAQHNSVLIQRQLRTCIISGFMSWCIGWYQIKNGFSPYVWKQMRLSCLLDLMVCTCTKCAYLSRKAPHLQKIV